MKKGWIQITIAILFIALFFFLLYLLMVKKNESLDHNFYEWLAKFINSRNTKIMRFFTFFGGTLGIALSIAVSFFFLKDNFDRGFFALSMLGEVALNNLIKIIVKRIRPTINPLVTETGYSFPSGHTMATTAFYSLVLFFVWKSPLPKLIKILISIPCVIMIIMVLISRVYLGVHYFSDVIAGLSCSIAYVLIITNFYLSIKKYFI